MPNPSPTPLSPNGPYSALLGPTRPEPAPRGPHLASNTSPPPQNRFGVSSCFGVSSIMRNPTQPRQCRRPLTRFGVSSIMRNPTQPRQCRRPQNRKEDGGRDPQCRSAQEEAQPLNDPKQAHLVAYPASENISQIDSLELSSRLLSSEVACVSQCMPNPSPALTGPTRPTRPYSTPLGPSRLYAAPLVARVWSQCMPNPSPTPLSPNRPPLGPTRPLGLSFVGRAY